MFGLSIYALFQRERMGRAKVLLDRHGVVMRPPCSATATP